MLGREPLVAEIAVDLVHALEPPDHQALQIQLRGDAQIHVLIERVVVRDEGARARPAGNRLHHRGLHLDEIERVEKLAQIAHDARACPEHVAAGLVDDQIHVPLPVARLHVGQAVPFVRQRPQRLDD
ncbi:hypothetical protein B1A_12618, partial [mine drainage metagenome]